MPFFRHRCGVLLCLMALVAACQPPWRELVSQVPPATALPAPVPTPSAPPVMGTPPGPVLTIAPLARQEFLVGVGPVGDADTGLSWQLWQGRAASWRQLSWPAEAIPRALRITPAGDVIFAVPLSQAWLGRGQPWGLLRSTDGGQSWQQATNGLEDPYVMDLVLSPAFETDRTLLALTWYHGVYYSTDLGDHWQALPGRGTVLPAGGVNAFDLALAVSPDFRGPPGAATGRGLIVASFSHQLQRWEAQRPGWRSISMTVAMPFRDFDPPETQLTAGAIAFSPDFANDGVLYLYGGAVGVFRSTDAGKTWHSVRDRLRLPPPQTAEFHLAVASAEAAYLLLPEVRRWPIAAPQSSQRPTVTRLYRTRDAGKTWQALTDSPTLGDVSAFALSWDELGRVVLHLGGSYGGVSSHLADALHWE